MLVRLQSINQLLLMVAPKPGGSPAPHQIPDQQHRCLNPGTAVDHIAAEHQMIIRGENRKQFQESLMTTVHVPDDPVVATGSIHR